MVRIAAVNHIRSQLHLCLSDFHHKAPNHGASLILPSLIALVESETQKGRLVSGHEFLLALIVGFEVSPRIGLAFGGRELLSRGIHSGVLMGEYLLSKTHTHIYI